MQKVSVFNGIRGATHGVAACELPFLADIQAPHELGGTGIWTLLHVGKQQCCKWSRFWVSMGQRMFQNLDHCSSVFFNKSFLLYMLCCGQMNEHRTRDLATICK